MKITEAQSTVAAHAAVAATAAAAAPTAPDDGPAAAEVPPPPVIVDRVTTDETVQFRASVANGVHLAATERAMRLQSLAQAVRAGTYQPSVSRLADQILAQAEMDARVAAAFS